ncbi:MAG: 50S ribosomal protein L22 [Puniceicoccales bacterium]|jgi:large subunit ribosomal protein L22|nr:50S ribosomal protein L22 [Puniceicoccales bacterium]
MKIEAKLKHVRISPKKMREISRFLNGKSAAEAISMMKCIPRKSARILVGLFGSAIANAENNNNLAVSRLVVESVLVEDGPVFKRFIAAARGSAHPIRKRMSHIRVVLKEASERKG